MIMQKFLLLVFSPHRTIKVIKRNFNIIPIGGVCAEVMQITCHNESSSFGLSLCFFLFRQTCEHDSGPVEACWRRGERLMGADYIQG